MGWFLDAFNCSINEQSCGQYKFLYIHQVLVTRRYCDPSCLFVRWCVRAFVCVQPPAAMTGGLECGRRVVFARVWRSWRHTTAFSSFIFLCFSALTLLLGQYNRIVNSDMSKPAAAICNF